MAIGTSAAYLPIYNYLFTEYSSYIAKQLSDLGKASYNPASNLWKTLLIFSQKQHITWVKKDEEFCL